MPEIIIRPAIKEDYPGIHKLLRQIAEQHAAQRPDLFRPHVKLSEQDYQEQLKTAEETPILVAALDGKIVGHLFAEVKHIKQRPHIKERRMFYIDDLCVDETCRGYGIGRGLMEEAGRLAYAHQCGALELNVFQCNENAVRFYERLGFAPQRLTMEKRLDKSCEEATAK